MKMDNDKLKGFIPLQQLQRIAQQKMKQKKQQQTVMQSQQNPNKLVVDKKIFNKYQITQDTIFYIKFGIAFIKQQQNRIVIVQYDKGDNRIQNHWLKFRMWTYQQCNRFKDLCCEQDQYKNYIYNKSKLFKINTFLLPSNG